MANGMDSAVLQGNIIFFLGGGIGWHLLLTYNDLRNKILYTFLQLHPQGDSSRVFIYIFNLNYSCTVLNMEFPCAGTSFNYISENKYPGMQS